MKPFVFAIGLAAALPLLHIGDAFAQGKPQTLTRLDVSTVASGYRASKIIGASVVTSLVWRPVPQAPRVDEVDTAPRPVDASADGTS